MTGVQLLPADTCFFGDGVPFSAYGSQEDIGGVFPPHPPTVVGALRATLARSNGWDGRGRWPSSLDAVLGDGPDLGQVSVWGPVLLRAREPLVPVPRHVVGVMRAGASPSGAKHWRPAAMLRPGSPVCCDLGDHVRLPRLPPASIPARDKAKTSEGWWLTRAGLTEILTGSLPPTSELIPDNALWSEERRVGLARDHATRTAKEGMLYSARHIRMRSGVSLGVRVDGVPECWKWPWSAMVPCGGESRLAELAPWDGDLEVPVTPSVRTRIAEHGRLLVVALTPLDLDPGLGCDLGFPASWGPVTLISACIDRPQRIGGWNSVTRQPLPLRSVLPAGSVLMCQVEQPKNIGPILDDEPRPPRLGARQAWGFGVIALGTWPEEAENNTR